MKLAIVVPCFNQLHITRQSLDSLFENTDNDFVVILVDDCSTDSTEVYSGILKQKYGDKFHYIRNPINYGVNRSWNVGVKVAQSLKAEYTIICNNDLLYTKDWEKPMLDTLKDEKIGVVSPLSTFGMIPRDWPYGTKKAPNPAGYIGYMPILGACFGCRTALFDDIGYFPEELRIYYGDNWIALICQVKGYKCGYVDSYVHHLFCQTSSKLNNNAIWPMEMPIWNQISGKLGTLKPFVQKNEQWRTKLRTWRD